MLSRRFFLRPAGAIHTASSSLSFVHGGVSGAGAAGASSSSSSSSSSSYSPAQLLSSSVTSPAAAAILAATTLTTSTTSTTTCQRRHQSEAPLPLEKVWALWNEGNLFSLNNAQLQAFLHSQGAQFDHAAKKAALIRTVEEVLQSHENQSKGMPAGGGGGGPGQQQQQDPHGRWQKSGAAEQETVMDLQSAGFYENVASMAPKAFQLLVGGHTSDLVVSRVNTTSFPGFPASNECYTLTAAISDLAVRARYSKALQWCVMNMRNLNLDGEFAVDFGKMLLKPEVVKKNRKIVSAWTLQQRAQINDPYAWVSAVSPAAVEVMHGALAKEGFKEVETRVKQHFDVHVRRKRDVVNLELSSEGKLLNGYEMWFPLQRAHLVSQTGGQDVRLQLRTRQQMRPQELQKVSTIPVLSIKGDEVTPALPPEMGQVIYAAENETRTWGLRGDKGMTLTVREIRRMPLIAAKAEDEDERIEYFITSAVPPQEFDLNWYANQLFDIARRFQEALTESFVAEYGTQVSPLAFENE